MSLARPVRPTTGMTFSLATIALVARGQSGAPPSATERRALFDWTAASGFAAVELSPRWLDFTTLATADLAGELAAAGLAVSGLNLNRCLAPKGRADVIDSTSLERAITVAARLPAPIVNLSLAMPDLPGPGRPPVRGDSFEEGFVQAAAVAIARLADRAADVGVRLSVELHDDGPLDAAGRLCAFLARVESLRTGRYTAVGCNPDLGNIVRGTHTDNDWRAALSALAPLAICWHVKNYRAGRVAPLWDGDIDHAQALASMRATGFSGPVSIESYFERTERAAVLSMQSRSRDYLQELLDRPWAGKGAHDDHPARPLA